MQFITTIDKTRKTSYHKKELKSINIKPFTRHHQQNNRKHRDYIHLFNAFCCGFTQN